MRRTLMAGVSVVAASAMMLAACGSSTTTKSSASPATSSASSKHVTITFMESMASGTQKVALPHLVKEFEQKYPSITVKLIVEPNYLTMQQKEEAAVAAGAPPTIAQGYTNLAATYAAAGTIVPLDSYVDGKDGISASEKADIAPAIWKNIHLADGKIWMWPFTKTILLDYYNADLLKKDGVSPPETWAQVVADAPKIDKNGDWEFSINPGSLSGPQHGTSVFLSMIVAYGGKWIVNGKPDFDSKAAVKALSILASLAKEGALKTGTSYPGQAALDAGHAAFDFSSNTGYPYEVSGAGKKFKLGFAALPSGPAGAGNYINGTSIMLFAKATPAQRSAAWTFMKWLTEAPQLAYWSEETGYLAFNKASIPLMRSYNSTHAYQGIANASVADAVATPGYAWWTEAIGELANAEAAAISGAETPQVALAAAEKAALHDEATGGKAY